MIPIPKPTKIPSIGSTWVSDFGSGLFLLEKEKAPTNALVAMNNTKIAPDKTLRPRMRYEEVFSGSELIQGDPLVVPYNGKTFIFYVANGKISYINYTDSPTVSTHVAGDSNSFDSVARPMLNMTHDKLVLTNGVDKLAFVDLSVAPFAVTKFVALDNPTVAPTLAQTGFSGTAAYQIYYCYTFNSTVGETAASPIANMTLALARDNWKSDGSQYVTLTRPTAPTGAKSWNVYIATASDGGSIQNSDMLQLASGIDINTTSFHDDGSIAINISAASAPDTNSTDGPVCKYSAVVDNGRFILYGDVNNPHNVWLGGDNNYPLDFTTSHSGYRLEIAKGTGYKPTHVMVYRTGTGTAVLRVDTNNSENKPKYYYVTPNTTTYGDSTFTVWGIDEQASGATGIINPFSVTAANDNLYFYSDYGFYTTGTKPQIQNVLSTDRISAQIQPLSDSIVSSAMDKMSSCYFNNVVYWSAPIEGNTSNNAIISYDLSGNGMWYLNRLKADFLFVLDDGSARASLFFVRGGNIYKFADDGVANDIDDMLSPTGSPFVVSAVGSPLGNNPAKSMYNYLLHAVFVVADGKGSMTVGVNYVNKAGKTKTRQKVYVFSSYDSNVANSWADVQESANGDTGGAYEPYIPGWSDIGPDALEGGASGTVSTASTLKRIKVPINSEYREVSWFINGQDQLLDFRLIGVEYKTIAIGLGEDL